MFTFLFSFLSGEAAIQEKELAEKQKEANDALIMIKETMQNASQQKTQMQDLRGEMTLLFVYIILSFFSFFSFFSVSTCLFRLFLLLNAKHFFH